MGFPLHQMIRNILLPLLLAVSADASAAPVSPRDMEPCFENAAEKSNLPVELLLAVAEVESGYKHLALNLGGATVLPSTRAEAEKILAASAKRLETFDIGVMQVNRWWFERYGMPYADGLDPCSNIAFGAKIL